MASLGCVSTAARYSLSAPSRSPCLKSTLPAALCLAPSELHRYQSQEYNRCCAWRRSDTTLVCYDQTVSTTSPAHSRRISARCSTSCRCEIERVKVLYEQYFMGIEKIEPQVARKEVAAQHAHAAAAVHPQYRPALPASTPCSRSGTSTSPTGTAFSARSRTAPMCATFSKARPPRAE